MLIGYARTSTVDQQAGFEAQLVELNAYGCERTYQEQVSAVLLHAPNWKLLLICYAMETSWSLPSWIVWLVM